MSSRMQKARDEVRASQPFVAITPEDIGTVYQLPGYDQWHSRDWWKRARRAQRLPLKRWVCMPGDRPLVVRYDVLARVLKRARKRNPRVERRDDRDLVIRYDRGSIVLYLHDATEVLGKLAHFHMSG